MQQGVGGAIGYHGTWFVNSACHICGSRAWNTKDTSRNVWYFFTNSILYRHEHILDIHVDKPNLKRIILITILLQLVY